MPTITRRELSAQRRREFHSQRVNAAADDGRRIWALAGWIRAEAARAAEPDRDVALRRLVEIADELNRRNGGNGE